MTTAPKPKRKAKAKAGHRIKVPGVTIRAKEMIVAHGAWMRTDDLVSKLEAEGYKPFRSSITTLVGDFRQSPKVLDRLGKLKGVALTAPEADA
jgi:hypothetical protein